MIFDLGKPDLSVENGYLATNSIKINDDTFNYWKLKKTNDENFEYVNSDVSTLLAIKKSNDDNAQLLAQYAKSQINNATLVSQNAKQQLINAQLLTEIAKLKGSTK